LKLFTLKIDVAKDQGMRLFVAGQKFSGQPCMYYV